MELAGISKIRERYQCELSVHNESKREDDTKNVLTVGFPVVGEKVGAFEGLFEGVALGVDLLKEVNKVSYDVSK